MVNNDGSKEELEKMQRRWTLYCAGFMGMVVFGLLTLNEFEKDEGNLFFMVSVFTVFSMLGAVLNGIRIGIAIGTIQALEQMDKALHDVFRD